MNKNKLITTLVILIVLIAGYEIILDIAGISRYVLPKPSLVMVSLWENWQWIIDNLKITLLEALIGFTLSVVLGSLLSLSCLFIPVIEPVVVNFAIAVRNIPFVAIAPILFMVLGYGPLPKIIIVMIVSFFPIMSNFSAGLHSVNQNLKERFFVLKATRWQLFTKLQLPASLPFFVTGTQIAVSNVVIAAIVGELLGTTNGLGFVIQMSVSQYRFPLLMAAVVITTIASILLTLIVQKLTKLILKPWLV